MDVRIDMSSVEGDDSGSDDLFRCPVCCEVMVDPSTLECGHNFCRLCLARWWKTCCVERKATSCPVCNQLWRAIPGVNTSLREAAEKAFGGEIATRRKELDGDKASRDLLERFNTARSTSAQSRPRPGGGPSVVQQILQEMAAQNANRVLLNRYGVCLFVIGFVVIFVCLLFVGGSTASCTVMPVREWNSGRVATWVRSLGDWAETYRDAFLERKINGVLLLQLGNAQLSELGMDDSLHRRTLIAEVQRLTEDSTKKVPCNLLQYVRTNPRQANVLQWGLSFFPRCTLFYWYLYDSDELFNLLARTVHDGKVAHGEIYLQVNDHSKIQKSAKENSGNNQDWRKSLDELDDKLNKQNRNQKHSPTDSGTRRFPRWKFFLCALIVPQYLLISVAWTFVSFSSVGVPIFIAECVLGAVYEVCLLPWVSRLVWHNRQTLPKEMAIVLLRFIVCGAYHYALFTILPGFIAVALFFVTLFMSPLDVFDRIWAWYRS